MALTPELGYFLQLQPSHVERDFWRSQYYSRCAHAIDQWSFYFTILVNGMTTFQRRNIQTNAIDHTLGLMAAVSIGLCHQLMATFHRHRYLDNRASFVLVCRVVCFALFVYMVIASRKSLHTRFPPLDIPSPTESPPFIQQLSPQASSILLILRSSLAPTVFHAGLNLPLPFLSQLTMHSLQLLVLVGAHANVAVQIVGWDVGFKAGHQWLCRTMNLFQSVVESLLLCIPQDGALFRQHCEEDASIILILFVQIYIGFVLPVYTAYRMEWHMKARYLIERAAADPGQIDLQRITYFCFPHLLDVPILLMTAAVVWVLVVHLHDVVLWLPALV